MCEEKMRKCSKCGKEKDDTEFLGNRKNYVKKCRECRERAYLSAKISYEKNIDARRRKIKEYKKNNPEKVREWHKKERSLCASFSCTVDGFLAKIEHEWYASALKEYYRKHYASIARKRSEGYAKAKTYINKLTIEEDPKEDKISGKLLVRCAYCRNYFFPKLSSVRSRVQALVGAKEGECRLYCSQACKDSCEVYRARVDPYARHASVERDPAWARRIKKAAKYMCERCGSKENLEAHHEIPVKVDQSLVNDEMNGICLCHDCHMKAHSESGCTLVDLRKL